MKHTDNGQDITFMKQNSKTYDIIRYIVLGAAVVVFLVAAGMLIHIFMEYKKARTYMRI